MSSFYSAFRIMLTNVLQNASESRHLVVQVKSVLSNIIWLTILFCEGYLTWLSSWVLLVLVKVELSSPKAELRILEVFYHKIYKVSGVFT